VDPVPTWYVSDLDGTLLAPDATLSPTSRRLLVGLLARGVPFTVASARSLVTMRQILGDLPLVLPVVGHNGAVVGELGTGRPWHVVDLGAELAQRVMTVVSEHGQVPILTTHDGSVEHLSAQDPANGGQAAYLDDRVVQADPRLRWLRDVRDALREPVITFTVIGERSPLEALHRDLARLEGLGVHLFDDLYAPGWCWITVHPAAASKATGLGVVAEHAGLRHHRLVVFGDQVNDLSMFEAADMALAMAHAPTRVAAAASGQIGSNADDAVAHWLQAHAR